jgi:hypothetical protein
MATTKGARMSDKDEQLERFREAVDRKDDEAEAASRATRDAGSGPPPDENAPGIQPGIVDDGRPQDTFSVRAKNTGKGKKTADKWNQ